VSQWVRTAVILTVIAVWAAVVLVSLVRGTVPDAITWGVPTAIFFALRPASRTPRQPGDVATQPPNEPEQP
jgi:hypothetical protein